MKAASIFSSVHIYRERYGGGGVYVCIKLHSFFTKKLLQHCTLKIQFIFICRFRRFQATAEIYPYFGLLVLMCSHKDFLLSTIERKGTAA